MRIFPDLVFLCVCVWVRGEWAIICMLFECLCAFWCGFHRKWFWPLPGRPNPAKEVSDRKRGCVYLLCSGEVVNLLPCFAETLPTCGCRCLHCPCTHLFLPTLQDGTWVDRWAKTLITLFSPRNKKWGKLHLASWTRLQVLKCLLLSICLAGLSEQKCWLAARWLTLASNFQTVTTTRHLKWLDFNYLWEGGRFCKRSRPFFY